MEWMIEFPCGEDVPGPASAGSFLCGRESSPPRNSANAKPSCQCRLRAHFTECCNDNERQLRHHHFSAY